MRRVSAFVARILQVLVLFFTTTFSSYAASVKLAWDPNTEPDLAGYRIRYGTASGAYTQAFDAGASTTATIPNLVEGTTYYFGVTAYNAAGLESGASNEVSFTPALPPNAPPSVAFTAPANGSTYLAPADISLSATASDSDGTVTRVEFYQGANKLGEVSSSPYAFSWNGVAPGTYSLTVRAIDNQGAQTTSTAVSVTVNAPNLAPVVALSSPANGSVFTSPANIVINANASDADGSVVRVEFYSGTTKLGEDTTAPYSFAWSGVTPGDYQLTAKAIDNANASTTSASVSVTVRAPNQLPTVAMTSPTNGTIVAAPANITLTASASDLDGNVARVEFYSGSTKLGEDSTSPYAFTWNAAPAGTYALTARAIDNEGGSSTSATVNVTVNAPPTVALSSNGTSFTAPASVILTATPADSDGTIARVEFYNGATKLGEDTTSPFAFTWSGVTPGTYTLTARAFDNQAAQATSAGVVVTVDAPNQAPTVAISSPASGTNFTSPTDIVVNANASDTDGFVARVEFYSGTTKLGEDTTAPYSFTWSGVTPGDYQLTAKAIDNANASTTSASVNVTVRAPNQLPTVAMTSPTNGTIVAAPANITLTASASDLDGTVARVEFYSGSTKLGEDSTSPYAFTWNTVPAGTYALTARAFDNEGGSSSSATVNVTVNAPPTVALSTNGTSFAAPASITLTATPADADGTISRVEFFDGATKLGEKSTSPFTFTWENAPAGNHALSARAFDNRGAFGNSATVDVTVAAPNQPPTVAITSPANGSSFNTPVSVAIAVTASDSDGTVSRVEFYQGTTKLGEDTTAPYSFTWNNAPAGTHSLTAVAIDDKGGSTTSTAVNITVKTTNTNPTVALTGPTNGQIFTSPATVAIKATAADSNGTIAKVEFYVDTTKLGQDTTSPYSYNWSNVTTGTYSVTAVATDNAGNKTTSAPVSITVRGPNVVLTTNGTNFTPGATISFAGATSQLSGSVRRVEFYRDSVRLYQDTKAPYTYSWSNVPAGTYALRAKAVMASGLIYTSDPVTVTVGTSQPSATMAMTSSYEDPMPTVIPSRQQDGTFSLGITGRVGQSYKVWVSTDLHEWSLMTTIFNDEGYISVTDPDASAHTQRYYRVSIQE